MKRLFAVLLFSLAMLFEGCVSARNEVSHRSVKETIDPATGAVVARETVEDVAKTDGHTFADGKQSVAKLTAGQTPKGGQRIGLTGQEQESNSELVKSIGEVLNGLVEAGVKAGAKAAVPIPTK